MSRAKPKVKSTFAQVSHVIGYEVKFSPQAGAKAKPGASKAKPIRMRKGENVVLLSGGNLRSRRAPRDPRAGLSAAMRAGTVRWAPTRRAHRAHRSRRAEGGQMEHAALRSRGPGLLPELSFRSRNTSSGFPPWRSLRPSRLASRSRRTCATSTSTRTTSSTRPIR